MRWTFLFLFLSFTSFAQEAGLSIEGGGGSSFLLLSDFDMYEKSHPVGSGQIMFDYLPNSNWQFRAGFGYNEYAARGSIVFTDDNGNPTSEEAKTYLKHQFITTPLTFGYKWGETKKLGSFSLNAGISVDYLLRATERIDQFILDGDTIGEIVNDYTSYMDKFSLSAVLNAGFNYSFPKSTDWSLYLGVRSRLSLMRQGTIGRFLSVQPMIGIRRRITI